MRLLIIGCGLSGIAATVLLAGCGSKKEVVERHLVAATTEQVSVASAYKSKLTINYYDDQLTGDWNLPDSNKTDSTEIESNGVRLSLKVQNGKLHYKAQAKPVARSTLEAEGSKAASSKKQVAVQEDTTIKKTVNRPNWKLWLYIAVFGAITILAVIYIPGLKSKIIKCILKIVKK